MNKNIILTKNFFNVFMIYFGYQRHKVTSYMTYFLMIDNRKRCLIIPSLLVKTSCINLRKELVELTFPQKYPNFKDEIKNVN